MKIKQYINSAVMIVFGIIIFQLASNFYSSIHYSFIYSGVPPTAYEEVLVEHILQIRTVISNFAMLLMFTSLVFVGIEIMLLVITFITYRKQKGSN